MGVVTVEAVVENGVIRLPTHVRLPDRTRVYVVAPGVEVEPAGRIVSPRLVRPEDATDFVLEVRESGPDAGLSA